MKPLLNEIFSIVSGLADKLILHVSDEEKLAIKDQVILAGKHLEVVGEALVVASVEAAAKGAAEGIKKDAAGE